MSRSRDTGWRSAIWAITDYPELKQLHDDYMAMSTTASYAASIHGKGGINRSTENAYHELPRGQQREYDAVTNALETVEFWSNAKEIKEMIRLKYWNKTERLTLDQVAYRINVSPRTTQRMHHRFVSLVKYNLGF